MINKLYKNKNNKIVNIIIIFYLLCFISFNIRSISFQPMFNYIYDYIKNNLFFNDKENINEKFNSTFNVSGNTILTSSLDSNISNLVRNIPHNGPLYLNINIVDKGKKNNIIKSFGNELKRDLNNNIKVFKESIEFPNINSKYNLKYKLLVLPFIIPIIIQSYIKYLEYYIYNNDLIIIIFNYIISNKEEINNLKENTIIKMVKKDYKNKLELIENVNYTKKIILIYIKIISFIKKYYLNIIFFYNKILYSKAKILLNILENIDKDLTI